MAFVHPGRMYVERHGLVAEAEDVLRYVTFLREEAGLGLEPPVDLARIYARFEMPPPKRAPLVDQQGLLLNAERGIVLIKADDPETRQRFTEGHELIEYLFDAQPAGKGWAARQAGVFPSADKERLCNEGAAELLMPRASFEPWVRERGVSFQAGYALAREYAVSVTAALAQMARVAAGRHAVVLWRMKHKPTERRSRPATGQLSLFGNPGDWQPQKKLRVEWSLAGGQTPYIPRDKSVAESSSIYAAWQSGAFTAAEEPLDLAAVAGMFRCENQPFEVEGERQVLSLLHLPGDAGCEGRRAR